MTDRVNAAAQAARDALEAYQHVLMEELYELDAGSVEYQAIMDELVGAGNAVAGHESCSWLFRR